jgi:hypothetical protein
VVAAAAALATGGCGNLSGGELERGVATLESLANEGTLLARDVARDRSKATFARVQARELADQAQHEAEKLNDATPSGDLGQERERAVELAGDLSDALGEIETAPGDEQRAARTERDLRTIGDATSDLLGRL